MRHIMILSPLLFAVLFTIAIEVPARAQEECPAAEGVLVAAIVEDAESLKATSTVTVTRLGSVEQKPVERCMELGIGDEIVSLRGEVLVELACPAGSSLTLSEQFRAIIKPPEGDQDCRVELAAGALGSNSTEPTAVHSGPVGAGALRTQYEVRVGREDGQPTLTVNVYEGQVQVTAVDDEVGTKHILGPGEKILHQRGHLRTDEIEAAEVERTSQVYARLAVGKANLPADQQLAAFHRFSRLYSRALFRPDDVYAQLELAETQIQYQMPIAALRQLSFARQAPTDPEIVRRMDALETIAREFKVQEERGNDNQHLQLERDQKIDPEEQPPR